MQRSRRCLSARRGVSYGAVHGPVTRSASVAARTVVTTLLVTGLVDSTKLVDQLGDAKAAPTRWTVEGDHEVQTLWALRVAPAAWRLRQLGGAL